MDRTLLGVRERAPYPLSTAASRCNCQAARGVVVWDIVNIEVWNPQGWMPRAMLSPPMGALLLPDIPNWVWHEYGMRVGFWRILEALQSSGVAATLALNGAACATHREACQAALSAG